MKHRRWGNVLHPLSRKGTYNMPQDDKTKHSARSMLPSLPLPVQSPFEKTILSDCLSLPLSQDLSQVTCRSAGTCHMPESRNPRKPISWELLSLLHRHKPLHTDYRKCLSEDARPLHQGPASVVLSAENEARCRQILLPNVAVYERERAKAQARGGQRGWAAVLVSLCSVGGEPALLFTLRSSKLKGRHKGDFAGGKQDPSDRDVVDTALREACEELGVSVAASSVWGTLKPLRDMSGMLVAPVLANLGPLEALSFCPSPNEVEEIFTITLAHLCDPKNRGYTNFRVGDRYGYTMPVFLNAKHRVWGLTAMALDHALKVIVPPGRGVQA
ncbi:hypothetical protein GJAV_G00052150 [Gymnothorax javanicus]|nr:hypothetical protein GJAV_G00052150 [Gymnothorax javanicus]